MSPARNERILAYKAFSQNGTIIRQTDRTDSVYRLEEDTVKQNHIEWITKMIENSYQRHTVECDISHQFQNGNIIDH